MRPKTGCPISSAASSEDLARRPLKPHVKAMNIEREGQVLEDSEETPPVWDVTPGWVGRNRDASSAVATSREH